ncbi:MAG: transporter [Micrococcaceae bacterium]|nr:transporter [Micrococcaceae bacterium]
MTPRPFPRRGRALWILLAAILLVALNLRAPIVAPAPVLGMLRDALQLSELQSGLLTTIPVLCFGLLAPLASLLIARSGPYLSVTLCLLGVVAGTVLRSSGGAGTALLGTVVIGAAITVGNVVVPVILHRDFPYTQVGLATGAYTAALNIGSMATSLLTAPLAALLGWRLALLSWAVVAAAALLVWSRTVGRTAAWLIPANSEPVGPAGPGSPAEARAWGSPRAWALMLAFAGQGFAYYAVTAWLPTLLVELQGQSAASAGAGSSLFQIAAVVGALGVPVIARKPNLRTVLVVVVVLWLTVPLGLMLLPALWPLWCCLGGAAQGGGITVIFIAVVRQSRNSGHARPLSTMVQGGGYVLASTGPLAMGGIRGLSHNWTAPLLVVLLAILVLLVLGLVGATPDRPRPGEA